MPKKIPAADYVGDLYTIKPFLKLMRGGNVLRGTFYTSEATCISKHYIGTCDYEQSEILCSIMNFGSSSCEI